MASKLRQTLADRLDAVSRSVRGRPPVDPRVEAERLASYPPPFPDGWYPLARVSEVGEQPLSVRALGRDLVVFRKESGGYAVLDAHCPHLGAHLGGGEVRHDCVECPFHRWSLDGAGRVVDVPYSEKLSKKLATRAWPTVDYHGFVCIYFTESHVGRGAVPQPAYQLPHFPEIFDGTMVHRGDHDAGVVRMHLIEFAENSVDFAHFGPVHGDMFVPWTKFKVPGLSVNHDATWEQDPEAPHMAWFRNHATVHFRGRPIPNSDADAAICIAGPAGVVSFHFDLPRVGRIILFQTHTPNGPLAQQVRFRWFAEPKVPRLLVSYVVGNWVSQWGEDIDIWENKVYLRKPMLVREDGPVHKMRKWYARFYEGQPLYPASDETGPGASRSAAP